MHVVTQCKIHSRQVFTVMTLLYLRENNQQVRNVTEDKEKLVVDVNRKTKQADVIIDERFKSLRYCVFNELCLEERGLCEIMMQCTNALI